MYHYPVFFECYGLREKHIKGIETYFRRGISGGGDCGPLIRLGEDVYGIAFRHEKGRLIINFIMGAYILIYLVCYFTKCPIVLEVCK